MKAGKLELEYMSPQDLQAHDDNPRFHGEMLIEELKKSIEGFGFTNPILATEDNVVLAGHARLKTALEEDLPEVPVIHLPFSEEEALGYMVFDNKINEQSKWHFSGLKSIMNELMDDVYDVRMTGFQGQELNDILDFGDASLQLDDEEEEEDLWDELEEEYMNKRDVPEEEDEEDSLGDQDYGDVEEEELDDDIEAELDELEDEEEDDGPELDFDTQRVIFGKYRVSPKTVEDGEVNRDIDRVVSRVLEYNVQVTDVEFNKIFSRLKQYNPDLDEENNAGFISHLLKGVVQ